MRRIFALVLAIVCVIGIAGCKGKTDVKIDYGTSKLYSKSDMDAAIKLIKKQFKNFNGCELHSITYGGDEKCNDENIEWMNDLELANDNAETFTECIMFRSSFHSPKEKAGTFNPDKEYEDWQWWLARSEKGSWKLMTWGY